MQASCRLVTLLLLLLLLSVTSGEKKLGLNANNQLEHLLIKVDSESLITPEFVANLKATLTEFSLLFSAATATVGRRLSLASARLVVPTSRVAVLEAANLTLSAITWESQQDEDVLFLDYGSSGGTSTVVQPEGCGIQGRQVRISADTFEKSPDTHAGRIAYKTNGRLLLQLLVRYMYGVYSEEAKSNAKVYMESGQMKLAACSLYRPVQLGGGTWSSCVNRQTLELSSSCYPDYSSDASGYACVLHGSNKVVDKFCDDSKGEGDPLAHNVNIDTDHNRVCNRRSVASVMRDSSHFTGTAGPTAVPELLLVKESARRVVLVLDVSGSMNGIRITNLKIAASRYILYFLETGAECTIVSFSTSAIRLMTRTINSEFERNELANVTLGLVAGGGTSISSGIYEAMSILGAASPYTKASTGFVVVFSDGAHNTGVSLDTAIADAGKTSIVFDSITLSSAADARMEWLANSTGGKNFFSPDSTASSQATVELDIAFASLASRVNSNTRNNMLAASPFSLPMTPITVTVDSSITHTLHFLIALPNQTLSNFNVTVTNPNGVVYGQNSGSDVYQMNSVTYSIVVKIPDSEIVAGDWTVFVESEILQFFRRRRSIDIEDRLPILRRVARSTSGADGSLVVVGGSGGSNSTFSLETSISVASIAQVTSSTIQKIFAFVYKDKEALTGAKVTATVTASGGWSLSLEMLDDGTGADLIASDGSYSCQLLPSQLTVSGVYSVSVSVTSPFSRSVSAGSFRVSVAATSGTKAAPGRVTDLRLTETNLREEFVRLQFTATGEEGSVGTPSHFELRVASSWQQLESNFTSCGVAVNLTGVTAGTVVSVTLWQSNVTGLVDVNHEFYVSTAAVSQSGLRGEAAVSVQVMLKVPVNVGTETETTTTPAGTTTPPAGTQEATSERPRREKPEEKEEEEWTAGFVALVAGEGAAIAGLVAAIVVLVATWK